MKTRLSVLAVGLATALVCFSTAPTASADDAVRKFGRGVSNLMWGWTDFFLTVHQEDKLNGPFAAYSYGVVKGVYKTVGRGVIGAYETGFFYLPYPDAYWPIIKPEFPLDTFNTNVLMYE